MFYCQVGTRDLDGSNAMCIISFLGGFWLGGFRLVDFGLGGFQMGGFRQVEMSRWKMAGGFQLSAHDCCFLFEERAVHWVLGD